MSALFVLVYGGLGLAVMWSNAFRPGSVLWGLLSIGTGALLAWWVRPRAPSREKKEEAWASDK